MTLAEELDEAERLARELNGDGAAPDDGATPAEPEAPPERPGKSRSKRREGETAEQYRKRRDQENAANRRWRQRRRERAESEPAPAREARKAAKATKRAASKARESIAPVAGFVWRQLGAMLEQTDYYPAGRIMGWQSTAAGEVIDELAAGTWIDEHALQPIMRQEQKAETVAMLVGPPLLAGMMSRDEATRDRLAPMLHFTIRQSLLVMLPAMEKARAREQAEWDAIVKLFGDTLPEGATVDSVVDGIMENLFAPPQRAEAPEPNGVPT